MYEEGVPCEEVYRIGDPMGKWKERAREKQACHNCKELGHWKNECPKPRRRPVTNHKELPWVERQKEIENMRAKKRQMLKEVDALLEGAGKPEESGNA